jgi:heme/copper-type cytochrome/quinol oxidase subunit 2
MPELISSYGDQIDDLFQLILIMTTVVAVGVLGLMIYSLVVFRHSEGRRAKFTHGSNKLEIAWTLATAGILIFIAVVQKDAWVRDEQGRRHLPWGQRPWPGGSRKGCHSPNVVRTPRSPGPYGTRIEG